jgi:hypothetical protein
MHAKGAYTGVHRYVRGNIPLCIQPAAMLKKLSKMATIQNSPMHGNVVDAVQLPVAYVGGGMMSPTYRRRGA